MRPRHAAPVLLAALGLGLIAGCEEEKRSPKSAPVAKAPIQTRPILGRTTNVIKDAPRELEKGGAQKSSLKITAKDPITLQGNAYVTSVGKIAIGQIQHSLDLYHATNERYPTTLDEFMNEIIKPNGIRLPQLPYYQEYGYDGPNHQLVVLEYPDRKEQFQQQQDKELGRTP
jgi:hypothetical protein